MTEATSREAGQLRQLARLHGIQTAYYDVGRKRVEASPEVLLAALRSMDAPVEALRDVRAALRERRQSAWRWRLEPVAVAWDGNAEPLAVRLPASEAAGRWRVRLTYESGETTDWVEDLAGLPAVAAAEVEGERYLARALSLPGPMPTGYHHVSVEAGGRLLETMVISAPRRAYARPDNAGGRWGVFLPLYALHSRDSWGAGSFADLERVGEWVSGIGGDLVATLPLLASFLDEPLAPSPYTPASRLFWNEFYLDLPRCLESIRCPALTDLLSSPAVQAEVRALRTAPRVDYRQGMALRRKILETAARCFFAGPADGGRAFEAFVAANPLVEDYAAFRAAGARLRKPWQTWPQPLRDGSLPPASYDDDAKRYHLFAQWLASEAMKGVARKARGEGRQLYLDLPLGVHPDGYDVWRFQDVFALGASSGAPPDAFFASGQDWGFPPLHPERLRASNYEYVTAYLRHHLERASLLRIDHVMGLHHLFWLPRTPAVGEGVYVRYNAEEMYAILSLESHRAEAEIVGENLGTVPRYVNRALARHNVLRMYALHYELHPDPRRPPGPVPRNAVASLNTHDMPPFAAFWRDTDIDERESLGMTETALARDERATRALQRKALIAFLRREGLLTGDDEELPAVLRASLTFLARSAARYVLVGLEDLWFETKPQNVPGTGDERPNWRQRARYTLEAWSELPEVVDALRQVEGARSEVRSRA